MTPPVSPRPGPPMTAAATSLDALLAADPRAAGQLLRGILGRDDAYDLLDGYGWTDGGCYLLAAALADILAGQRHPYAIVGLFAQDRIYVGAQHVLIRVEIGGTAWYLDADGAASYGELMYRWRTVEGVPSPVLVDLTRAGLLLHPETPRDPARVTAIAAYLADALSALPYPTTRET